MTDATYLKFTILSLEDRRTENREFIIGDKFLLLRLDESFSSGITSFLKDKKVILEHLGYALAEDGTILNDLITVDMDDDLTFRWLLTDDELRESFFNLGNEYQHGRFVMLDI